MTLFEAIVLSTRNGVLVSFSQIDEGLHGTLQVVVTSSADVDIERTEMVPLGCKRGCEEEENYLIVTVSRLTNAVLAALAAKGGI